MSLKSLLLTRVSHPSYTGGNGGWLDPAGIILDVRQPKLVSAALGRFGLVGSLLEETTMGIMDEVKGKLGSLQGSDSKGGSLLSGVMEMFSGQGSGGLQGLVNLFHQRGLGDKVSSWVSRGENQAISPEEVKQGLGNDKVRDLASRSGMSEDEAATHLSQHLPDFVDKMTPDGQVPEGGGWLEKGMEFLKGRFK